MSFIFFPNPTPVFPTLPVLGWSVHKKPIMASRTTIAASGRENKLACAVYPRWAFTLTYGGDSWLRDQTQNIVPDPTKLGLTEMTQISSIFLQCQGSYGEFYFTDPDDNSREGEYVGVGDGTTTEFPIYYTWGNGPFTPSLTLPVGGINTFLAVYINGVVQSPSTYTTDATNTQIVFNTAPEYGLTITVDFSFYFRCRFLDDTLSFSQFAQNLWDLKEIRFESVKP